MLQLDPLRCEPKFFNICHRCSSNRNKGSKCFLTQSYVFSRLPNTTTDFCIKFLVINHIQSGDESKQKLTWKYRISRVILELVSEDAKSLLLSENLTIEGLINLIGMVSYGKSTLMIVLSVLLARRGLYTSIVLGDVISVLEQAKIFHKLGISVAPVLGASNRDRHANRLHRAWHSQNSKQPLNLAHPGFQWLSTSCPLSELRRDAPRPFKMREQPCIGLTTLSNDEEREKEAEDTEDEYACPIYSACPFHKAQRDLVKAQVWIATPASLVYTRVASQINRESIRFLELVYLRSDLVIIDEVDQVQVQLDNIFCPNQKLFGAGGDGWFSKVQQPVVEQLNFKGRVQLADDDTDNWSQAHATAQIAVDRIYNLLLKNPPALKKWSERGDYFTYWLILSEIANSLCGKITSSGNDDQVSERLVDLFGSYLNDPLGDHSNHPLAEISHKLLLTTDKDLARQNLREWILNHQESSGLSEKVLDNTVVKMEFALLVAVLQQRFNSMLRDWKLAEEVYKLEGGSSLLFQTPPRDYEPVVPTAPMGNILAFQYVQSTEDAPGDLRFFKCLGVGRWLLLHLHELYAGEGIIGPNVLLLSGTSWAGKSPGYHIQVPVAGVLRSPEEELKAIEKSKFRFEPYFYDDLQQLPIRVSGSKNNERDMALKELLNQLAQQGGLGGPSKLEEERTKLPKHRQRILLLVSSYEQAKLAQEHLEKIRPEWREQVMRLVCDDDQFETDWCGSGQSIQRGLVSKFPSTEAWILIAPLMAIERGHNILNEFGKATFGAAYFLVRPHPRPDDINYAIHSINRWAVEKHNDAFWLTDKCENDLLTVNNAFLNATYRHWRYLLRLPMIYSLGNLGNELQLDSNISSIRQRRREAINQRCRDRTIYSLVLKY